MLGINGTPASAAIRTAPVLNSFSSKLLLIVASGSGKDPMNDPRVRVGFYVSDDRIVRDGAGGVATDYTFAIKPDAKMQAFFDGASRNGVIAARATDTVWIHGPDMDDLELAKAQLRLEMKADGALSGLVGGYRPWLPFYEKLVNARGPVVEALTWVRLPDIYYALRRHADYSPTGAGGEKTYISYELRVDASPAYVMSPDRTGTVTAAQAFAIPPAPTRTAAVVDRRGSAQPD